MGTFLLLLAAFVAGYLAGIFREEVKAVPGKLRAMFERRDE